MDDLKPTKAQCDAGAIVLMRAAMDGSGKSDQQICEAIYLAMVKTAPDHINDAVKLVAPTLRLIPDSECVQGKCGCTTTGCWDECNMKRFPVTLAGVSYFPNAPCFVTEAVGLNTHVLIGGRPAIPSLTDAEIGKIHFSCGPNAIEFARAIEKKVRGEGWPSTKLTFMAIQSSLARNVKTAARRIGIIALPRMNAPLELSIAP